jgi:SET domain-containing protein
MHQIPGLYTANIKSKGRGVFTCIDISPGDIIEVCPVIHIPKVELPIIHKTVLHDYYFLWGEAMDEAVIALGFGSLYNHALHPNADFILDFDNSTIDIVAIIPIAAGDEITINYNGEPGDDSALWF